MARERYFVSWYEGSERDLSVRLAEGRINPSIGIDWYYKQDSGTDYLFVDALPNSSAFAVPVAFDDNLHIIWENDEYAGTELEASTLVVRSPDVTVLSPALRALNFPPGGMVSQDVFRLAWNEPPDASNIEGYSYRFSLSPLVSPREEIIHLRDEELQVREELEQDGTWYFSLVARDYAGNWSPPVRLSVVRDTTPPAPPVFKSPAVDEQGFLRSNTATLDWFPSPEEDTAGYTYTYSLLNPAGESVAPGTIEPELPPQTILTTSPESSFVNRDNGTWLLSVAAVDRVGNVGRPAALVFRTNKYIPVTIISSIEAAADEVGRTLFTIRGRGFTAGGQISRILLDRDGSPPYDYAFPLDEGLYRIINDRLITDFAVEDIDEGEYGLGLDHQRRGVKWSDESLYFEPSGVVKFGDFSYVPPSRFTLFAYDRLGISVNTLVLILILAALGLAFGGTLVMIRSVVVEGVQIRRDVEAIVHGRLLTGPEYRKRIEEMRRKGIGLRVKFVLLLTVLILIVVLMVAVSLGFYMIESRQRTLAEGLQNRSSLLLESLAVGARDPIDTNDLESIQSLAGQVEAMQDATGVVITGRSVENPLTEIHALWIASNPDGLVDELSGRIRIDYRSKEADEDAPRQFALIEVDELAAYRDRL